MDAKETFDVYTAFCKPTHDRLETKLDKLDDKVDIIDKELHNGMQDALKRLEAAQEEIKSKLDDSLDSERKPRSTKDLVAVWSMRVGMVATIITAFLKIMEVF